MRLYNLKYEVIKLDLLRRYNMSRYVILIE